MFDEVRQNEPNDEPDWSVRKGKHFLNKWVSPENKVYQINEVVFRDEDERELPTNDPVSIDLVVQMYVSGWRQEEELLSQVIERGQELFGEETCWEFEVNETELCFVW